MDLDWSIFKALLTLGSLTFIVRFGWQKIMSPQNKSKNGDATTQTASVSATDEAESITIQSGRDTISATGGRDAYSAGRDMYLSRSASSTEKEAMAAKIQYAIRFFFSQVKHLQERINYNSAPKIHDEPPLVIKLDRWIHVRPLFQNCRAQLQKVRIDCAPKLEEEDQKLLKKLFNQIVGRTQQETYIVQLQDLLIITPDMVKDFTEKADSILEKYLK